MRFNPNLYTNGKVCLSILNTWKGEGWSSCQTIYSILLILSNVLNENPLLNEPGIKNDNNNIFNYNLLLKYKNLEFAIIKQINYLEKTNNLENNKLEKNYDYFDIIKLFNNEIIENFKKINHQLLKI